MTGICFLFPQQNILTLCLVAADFDPVDLETLNLSAGDLLSSGLGIIKYATPLLRIQVLRSLYFIAKRKKIAQSVLRWFGACRHSYELQSCGLSLNTTIRMNQGILVNL